MANSKRHLLYFDILNITACLCVIAMHVNGVIWAFSYERYWVTSLIIETVSYWAVPVFFMISGANLIDYREHYDTKVFLKKRLTKTALPFLFWSIVSIFWATFYTHSLAWDSPVSPLRLIEIIFNTEGLSIYWFFIPLFSLYLCIPFLSYIPKEKRISAFLYLSIYGGITIGLLPFFCSIVGITYNNSLQAPLLGSLLIFALLGYLLSHMELSRKVRCIIYCCGVLGWALRYFGTLYLSYRDGGMNQTFGGPTNLPTLMFASAVFVWFRYHDWSFLDKPKIAKVIRMLSGASFGVYLTHFYIMQFLTIHFPINVFSWQWRIGGVLLVYVLALAFTLCIQHIPFLKKLVP